jgi:hypothetical protein
MHGMKEIPKEQTEIAHILKNLNKLKDQNVYAVKNIKQQIVIDIYLLQLEIFHFVHNSKKT